MRIASISVALLAFLPTATVLGAPEISASRSDGARVETLTLPAALGKLAGDNLSVVQARSRAGEAAALVRQAQAALLPTATLNGSYVRNSTEAEVDFRALLPPNAAAMAPDSMVIQPRQSWTASASLRVPLLALNAWYDVEAAQAAARASDAHVAAAHQQIRTAFAQSAYGGAALEQVVAASERALVLAREQVVSAERRVQAGTTAPLDVLRAKAELVQRESDLARARAELERARLALGVLLGRPRPVRVVVPELVRPRTSLSDAPHASAGYRPELEALRAQQNAARARIDSAWARYVPQLSASGSIFASDVPYPTGDKSGWRISVDLMVPLYDGGVRYGKRREAQAALGTANAALEEEHLRIRQRIEDANREIAVAREQGRLAKSQQQLFVHAAASAKRSYDAGVATTLDVLDANDKLYRADVAVADARARLAQAILAYERAVGMSP